MKPIEIPDFEDERVNIPFTVPVKERKPLEFTVKRLDFIPEDEFDELVQELDVLDGKTEPVLDDKGDPLIGDDGEPVTIPVKVVNPREAERQVVLTMLKHCVTPKQLETLTTLSHGQLNFVKKCWQEQSRVSLGEYWASASSSTSTRRPSNSTSSPTDTTDSTSVAGSGGESSEAS